MIRRRRWTYSFRAWINEHGSNEDHAHERHCGVDRHCEHLRLWDLNTTLRGRNIVRVVQRRRPFFLRVVVGPRYWTALRIGRSDSA